MEAEDPDDEITDIYRSTTELASGTMLRESSGWQVVSAMPEADGNGFVVTFRRAARDPRAG